MLYHLSLYLKQYFHFFNVVHYVSFRALAALLSTLLWALTFGDWFIRQSGKFFRSKARKSAPARHQELKDDMPTMGGVFILAIVVINCLLWCDLTDPLVWLLMTGMVGFGAIGAWDDWYKIKHDDGLRAVIKFGLQACVALAVVGAWWYFANPSTALCLPFFKQYAPELGMFFIPWAVFVIVGCSNAVNLTDGLDGLAIGSLIYNFATFSIICYLAGNYWVAGHLHIPFAGTGEIAICGTTLVGASLGFLWFNAYPAQIFMGDVGSLGLGAALALMALLAKQELLLAISGGLFVFETITVIVQVLSLKIRGRRLFKMAPIHHHFELLGWHEPKITVRFGIITLILCLLALITLKIR